MSSASKFTQLNETVVYDGAIIKVAVGEFRTPNGDVVARDLVRHPGAVSVVPIVGDCVVMVRQYRAALGLDLLEIPAGKRDIPGEAPEITAARELAEEIGLVPTDLRLLAQFYNSAGFCDELSYVYLATEFESAPIEAHGEEEQHMQIVHVPLTDIDAMIADARLCDAKSIIGLALARTALAVRAPGETALGGA